MTRREVAASLLEPGPLWSRVRELTVAVWRAAREDRGDSESYVITSCLSLSLCNDLTQ